MLGCDLERRLYPGYNIVVCSDNGASVPVMAAIQTDPWCTLCFSLVFFSLYQKGYKLMEIRIIYIPE